MQILKKKKKMLLLVLISVLMFLNLQTKTFIFAISVDPGEVRKLFQNYANVIPWDMLSWRNKNKYQCFFFTSGIITNGE